MASAKAETLPPEPRANAGARAEWFRSVAGRRSIPYIYLAIALATALLLCFLVPPMQSPDEGRHFLRASQIAQGQILPQIDPATHEAGGLLPAPEVDFVRDKMNPEYFRNEDRLPTIGARLRALDQAARNQAPLAEKEFAVFPGSAIYPPALYLPQAAGIRLAGFFSNKVYVWFYSARLLNAITAVFLVFFALWLAPGYQFALLIPAILPISLYQISSVSSDAEIIALSILFVTLCIRFISTDGAWLRSALVVCLLLLTLGKPVHLPFALLLLAAYKRLGWRHAVLFCSASIAIAGSAYLAWSYFVRPVFALAGADFPGHNPPAQVRFIFTHPVGFVLVLLRTAKWDARQIIVDTIGSFGWSELPLPRWFYWAGYAFFAAIFFLALLNWRKVDGSRLFFGGIAAAGMLLAISIAGFVLWSPVGSADIPWLQGRYFIPVLAVFPFFIPPIYQLRNSSKFAFACVVLGFSALSIFTTVRIVKHYYFPESSLLGKNIRTQFAEVSGHSCPASIQTRYTRGWFSTIATGRAHIRGDFRVFISNENGTILGESDPTLAGADFPYDLLPGSSHSNWLVHLWTPNRFATLHYWLVTGKNACTFGPDLKFVPYHIPSA